MLPFPFIKRIPNRYVPSRTNRYAMGSFVDVLVVSPLAGRVTSDFRARTALGFGDIANFELKEAFFLGQNP